MDVASRMKELEATGPVLKAGPIAAFTVVKAPAASESSRDKLADGRHGGSDLEVYDCKFSVDCVILFLSLLGRATKPIYSSPLVTSLISVSP